MQIGLIHKQIDPPPSFFFFFGWDWISFIKKERPTITVRGEAKPVSLKKLHSHTEGSVDTERDVQKGLQASFKKKRTRKKNNKATDDGQKFNHRGRERERESQREKGKHERFLRIGKRCFFMNGDAFLISPHPNAAN